MKKRFFELHARITALSRASSYHFSREGWRALHRVPARLDAELATFGRTAKLAAKGRPVSVTSLIIDQCNSEEIALLNREAQGTSSDWLLFLPRECIPNSNIVQAFSQTLAARPDADVVYADEDFSLLKGLFFAPRFKPDFNPELLCAINYIGFPVLMRRTVFLSLGGLRSRHETAALHNLWLRAWKLGFKFVRLPEVLIHNKGPGLIPQQEETLEAVSEFCQENFPDLKVRPGLVQGTVEVFRKFNEYPEVTIIVPTCQSPLGSMAGPHESPVTPHILYFLQSLALSTWPKERLRVLVMDDREDGSCYLDRSWPFRVHRLFSGRNLREPFNYAKNMNVAWRHAETEMLIFVNDDIRVLSPGWIEALMTFALEGDIGGTGARLLFPDGRLQHAGVVAGPFNTAVHAWFGHSGDQPTYGDWALVHRDWSMVTGAVFATRRSVMEEVNGFDESFALEFNDLDLCLRLGLLGYRIVYTPFAELFHFERSSRGPGDTPPDELFRFRRRWKDIIADDPAYNPRLSRDGYAISAV